MASFDRSGNFDHDPRDDDDDEKLKRRSRESRVKDRARLIAGLEVGDQEEWERFTEVAGGGLWIAEEFGCCASG